MISKVTLPYPHHLRDIRNQNVFDLDIELWNEPRSNVNMSIESPNLTYDLMTIVMFASFLN